MTTRTALELWERLVQEAGEELIERAASVSVAQAEKELRAVGFDVEAERAEGEAFLADLERPTEVERPREKPVSETRARALRPERRRPSGVVVIAAVTAAAAAAGGLIYAATHKHSEQQQPAPPPPPTSTANPTSTPVEDVVAIAKMRRDEAFSACTNGLYSRCADLLDQAEQLDPAGESEPRVVEARAKIAAAQHPPTPQPKPLAPQPNPEEKPLK